MLLLDRARRLQQRRFANAVATALCRRARINASTERGDYNEDPGTRAIPAGNPNNRLEYMKSIVQTANVEGETIPLREVIPFWFAVSSPLLGALLGLLGAWFVAWLSA